MKKLLGLALVGSIVSPAMAVVYTDALGDLAAPLPFGNNNMDIVQFEMTNDATSIVMKLTTNTSDITSPNWHKFNFIGRTPSGPLDTASVNNAWGRNYGMAGGANLFVGGWFDGSPVVGGFEARKYDGSSWTTPGASYLSTPGFSYVLSGNTVTYTMGLSTLGLVAGDVLTFDVVTTGDAGNHTAFDALSSGIATTSDDRGYVQVAGNLTYQVVPEPASMTALALGAAAMLRRRKKA